MKKQQLNESFLAMFGGVMKEIVRRMFGDQPHTLGSSLTEEEDPSESKEKKDIKFSGTQCEIDVLVKALVHEKAYMQNYMEHGLNNDDTKESKYKLDDAVKNFEQSTGIKWPFK